MILTEIWQSSVISGQSWWCITWYKINCHQVWWQHKIVALWFWYLYDWRPCVIWHELWYWMAVLCICCSGCISFSFSGINKCLKIKFCSVTSDSAVIFLINLVQLSGLQAWHKQPQWLRQQIYFKPSSGFDSVPWHSIGSSK